MLRKSLIHYLLLAFVSFAFVASGCEDPPKPLPPKKARKVRRPPPAAPGAQAGAEKVPEIILSESDFVESESNRDPFRSYLGQFVAPESRVVQIQRKIKLQKYALEELHLIAIVSGGIRARAMFRDPSGLGVAVKRGDYISKSGGRVKQILSDKVVVQIEKQTEEQQMVTDRVIELHPKNTSN